MNTAELTHPSHENLSAFNNGRLDMLESAVIERHLAECETCCGLLKTLPNDTLVVLLSQSETDTKSIPGRVPALENSFAHRPGDISPTLAQIPAAANPTIIGKTVAPCDIPAELQNHPRYRIVSLIGRGGMGSVYEAEHRLMNRPVALKVIDRQLVQTPGLVERFQREMQTAARLSHPNIVAAHDAERADNLHFLVMELVRGQDLSQLVRERGKLPVHEACEYVRQAAVGLQHAFERGMVHRDIKPQNLMLTPEGQVKILDFGLAQFASEVAEESGLTQVGAMMGTPDYMAPEQARDAHSADIRADIYALGCTLYYLLSGQTPFPQGTVMEKVLAHVEREPKPLAELRNDVPAGLTVVIKKMMAKAPVDRYQTPADVVAALLPFTTAAAAVVMPTPNVVLPAAAQSDKRMPRSPAFYAWLALAAFAFFGALGVIVIMTDKGTIEIQSEVDDVQIVVRRGGEQIDIIDAKTGTQAKWLPSGNYEIELQGDLNGIVINKNVFTLTRWGKQIVTIRKHPTDAPPVNAAAVTEKKPVEAVWTDVLKQVETKLDTVSGYWNLENGVLKSGTDPDAKLAFPVQLNGDYRVIVKFSAAKGNSGGPMLCLPVSSHLYEIVPAGHDSERVREVINDAHVNIPINPTRSIGSLFDADQVYVIDAVVTSNSYQATIRVKLDGERVMDWTGDPKRFSLNSEWQLGGNSLLRLYASEPFHFHNVELQMLSGEAKLIRPLNTSDWKGWSKDAPPAAIAPFNTDQAKKHQDAWAKHIGIPAEFVDKSGVRFNLIPPGEFLMGSPKEEMEKLVREVKQAGANDYDQSVANVSGPQHHVRITRPFYASAHEITVGEFRRFVDDTHYLTSRDQLGAKRPSWTESAKGENAELRAVIGVSWDDAKAYCAWRSKRDGVTIDLPTEAQWEYACRAGTTTPWSFGDDPGKLSEYAVFHQKSFWPAEVIGTKKANPFGLFDMHGNADEWCLDWHSSGFYATSPVNDPVMLDNPGDVNSGRVARGGTSQSVSWWTRSATRPWDFPATPINPKGFRIVITGDLKVVADKIGKGNEVIEEGAAKLKQTLPELKIELTPASPAVKVEAEEKAAK